MTWTHIINARVYAPKDLGVTSVLCFGDRIIGVGSDPPSGANVETVDAAERLLLPGLIDPHIHVMGSGGGGDPLERSTDMPLSRITAAGVTTIVSPLGTDSLSRTIPALLTRARALTAEGITAYAYTGGWCTPVPTLTGDAQTDLAFIDNVLGIKIAIAEKTAPPLTDFQLAHLAHAAVIGGGIAGKRSVLHAHIGDREEGLQPLWDTARDTGLPMDRFVATHVNRNSGLWEQAKAFAAAGGSVDITTQVTPGYGYPNALDPARCAAELAEAGLIDQLTLSTDAGAIYPIGGKDIRYMADPRTLLQAAVSAVGFGLTWEQAACITSTHAADLLGLIGKGRICSGADADLVLITEAGAVDHVWAKGVSMVQDGKPIVFSNLEKPQP